MLELLVWKKYAECTSQRVKRTSGARDLTISFRQLSGPITLKLPDLNIVFYTISFRNVPGRKFLKQPEGQKLLNSRGPAPDCFSAFPVAGDGVFGNGLAILMRSGWQRFMINFRNSG